MRIYNYWKNNNYSQQELCHPVRRFSQVIKAFKQKEFWVLRF